MYTPKSFSSSVSVTVYRHFVVDFVEVGGFRGFRFLGSGFRGNKWISRISLFRQTGANVQLGMSE